ncbi:unnamed protein product [Miscanthus lutarioriparius]|uniref:F-box domain-containing protein n=1 Tax=Miscanthus lutarioriparius TaxID=422564 RepID=A0A811S3V9_9POAL|nr:unnamed protein product [Miscanthus lutarioriparius]
MTIGGADDGAGIGAKKQRVDEQGDGSEAVGADPIPVDRISALPDDLRRRILTHLALKEAIRTGALARGWRDLWDRGSVEVCLRSRNDPRRELGALEQEPPPRLRMDRFSLVAETSWLKSSELKRFIRYAADCRVEDLHVETRKSSKNKLNFHLPLSSRTLVCLSLRRISISNMYYRGARPFRALEAIRLYSVSIKVGFTTMMELCPSLVTLDLRGCDIRCDIRCDRGTRLLLVPRTVKSVTVAECDGYSKMWLMLARNLRSFRYSGDVCRGLFYLPWEGSVLADLYIRSTNLLVASYSLPSNGVTLPSRNLNSLRELQLLMLDMEAVNLADLYVFPKTCRCPNLERLFVQLPSFSNEPVEGPIDEVREEPPQDGFDDLVMVKVMNFNWRPTEVQLSVNARKVKNHVFQFQKSFENFHYSSGLGDMERKKSKSALAQRAICHFAL